MQCPKCHSPLTFISVLVSSNPARIKCRACKEFIRVNTLIAVISALLAIVVSFFVLILVLKSGGGAVGILASFVVVGLLVECAYFALINNGVIPSDFTRNNKQKKEEHPIDSIITWLSCEAPALTDNFEKGIGINEMVAIEEELGVVFPEDIQTAYLKCNGEVKSSDGIFGLWRWLPLLELKYEYKNMKLNTGDSNKVPLLVSPGGDILYFNSGHESKLFECNHEVPEKGLIRCSSFEAYLKEFSQDLANGKYVYVQNELSGLVDKNEL